MPDTLERGNLREIEMLNQRGGRTLSIADLMEAGTITPEAAGFAMWHVARGASLLTGAVPGGAGKSTLLADLLGMLPPGEEVVTTPDDRSVSASGRDPDHSGKCYLCHEFGHASIYGYLWGPTVGRFLELNESGGRIAACLHADDVLQTRSILVAPHMGVDAEAFGRVGLMLFMAVDGRGFGASRQVRSVSVADGAGGHRLAFDRDPGTGELVSLGVEPEEDAEGPSLAACQEFMAGLLDGDLRMFEDVREASLAFYSAKKGQTPFSR
ncbi:MAG: hypothetical protein ISS72_10715 [Candidatus Brocadiae bacterium]|nr:hypothetical protein [Candidatus Brocadiia bacterium]